MDFFKLNIKDSSIIKTIYQSYSTSFPPEERRNEEQFVELFNNKKSTIFSIIMNNEMVGYLVTWKLKNAVFIEHFEILETYRNQKLGSKVLLEFSVFYPFLILESEPSFQSEIAERRIAFYKRNNFKKIKEDYIQPAYDKDKPSLQLFLLSNFEVENIDTVVKEIHAIVYSVS